VRAVAKLVVMMCRIGARNELTCVNAVNTAAMSDIVPEKRPRISLSPQRGEPTLLCKSAMSPNQTSTPLPAQSSTLCLVH
jgi:hypothetical protein